VLGLAQQWRGAHFMSHTLWSAAVCWMIAWLVHASWPPSRIGEGT
jgi:membrane-associated PAP2 superfamily phosphatase